MKGVVGTPRPLTGYKRGVCHMILSELCSSKHKLSVIMVKAQVKQNGRVEVPQSSSKDADVIQSLLCLSKREQ